MGKPKVHLAYSSKEGHGQSSSGCTTSGPFATALHDIYRKLGLCECAGAPKRA